MARFCPIFSGSSANSTYIGFANGGILIDAGSSFSALKRECEKCEIDLSTVKALLITHTHSDHIKGISPLLKNLKIPVIASAETLSYLAHNNLLPPNTVTKEIGDTPLEVSGALVNFFGTSHDAAGSGGYTVTLPDENKISVCTDLGIVTDTVRNAISGSNLLLLEFNHDLNMLKKGPYPPELKMRIMSDCGHLSNHVAANELKNSFKSGTNRFVLGHLSLHNNLPALAASATKSALLDFGAKQNDDYILSVAAPQNNGVIYL